ncbi:hypothetical protein SprV_0301082700 [Sparganum proliferum]
MDRPSPLHLQNEDPPTAMQENSRSASPTERKEWRMRSQSHASTATINDLLFASSHPLNATTEGDVQSRLDLFAAACDNLGLVINTEKTVAMQQPPNAAYNVPHINANGAQPQAVDTPPAWTVPESTM